MIFILTGCESIVEKWNDGYTVPAGESYELVGMRLIDHEDYFIQMFSKGSEMNSTGIFLKSNQRLLVDLGSSNYGHGFFEGDNFYYLGTSLVIYNLKDDYPADNQERIMIFPENTDVQQIYGFDDEYIYARAKFWDYLEARHESEPVYVKVNRDDYSYTEIEREELPEYEFGVNYGLEFE